MSSTHNLLRHDYRGRGSSRSRYKGTRKPSSAGGITWNKHVIIAISAIGLLTLIYWGGSQAWKAGMHWLSGTSWAVMDRIEVRGLVRLPELDIFNAAAVEDSSNLMKLDLDSVSARVERIAGVKQARSVVRLPGRLVIHVEERIPIAAVGNGDLVLIDEEGIVFYPEYGGEVIDVPIITGDMKLDANDQNYKLVISAIVKIKYDYPEVYRNLGELHVSKGNLQMRLRQGGALIKSVEQANLDNLELFLKQKGNKLPPGMEYVDLRFAAMVITGTKG